MTHKQNLTKKPTRRQILKYGLYSSLAAGLSPAIWLGGCGKSRQTKNPNIILVTLDTTRIDRLSCYGYHQRTSPYIDNLAQKSLVYSSAVATSSWTLPSHASLFTGKFTTSHGARYDPHGPFRLGDAFSDSKLWQFYRARGLAANEVTMADILQQAGYTTAAVVAGPWLKKVFGLNQGFQHYDDNYISTLKGRPADNVSASAFQYIGNELQDKRFFLFLNYFDPHYPYTPPASFLKKFFPNDINPDNLDNYPGKTNANYDAEICFMDYHFGWLLEQLKDCGLFDNSWIIVTADHGELLGEHGVHGHGSHLFQEEIHIPLIVKYPAGEIAPTPKDLPIELTDILPMICERLDIDLPKNIQGSPPSRLDHPVISETYPLKFAGKEGHWRAFFEDNYKYLWNSNGNHQLYDLATDHKEILNLAEKEPQLCTRMQSVLNEYLAKLPKPGPPAPTQEIDEETQKALKSLGYVQ